MSSCPETTRLVLASVEGILDEDGQARLESHLTGCAVCRRALTDQTVVKRLLQEIPLADVSPGFATRVRQRVTETPWFDLINWRIWTLSLAPVAALLVLLAWLPIQNEAPSTQSLSAVLDSWAVDRGDAATQALLKPDTDINTLLADQFEASSR